MTGAHALYDNFYTISQWEKIAGKLKWISVSQNFVIGVNKYDDIYYRYGINSANPKGTTWIKVSGKLAQIDVYGRSVWGSNSARNLYSLTVTPQGKTYIIKEKLMGLTDNK